MMSYRALVSGPALSGERARTNSASAIALFHWPVKGSLFEAGRAFYRTWLQASALGFVDWPAAALADHEDTTVRVSARFGVPPTDKLINTLKLGRAKAPPAAHALRYQMLSFDDMGLANNV